MNVISFSRLLRLILLVPILWPPSVFSGEDFRVESGGFSALFGTVIKKGDFLQLAPDASGAVFVYAPGPEQPLESFSRAEMHLEAETIDALSLVWTTGDGDDGGFMVPLSFSRQGKTLVFALPRSRHWNSIATRVGFKIDLPPGGKADLYSLRFYPFSVTEWAADLLLGVNTRQTWKASDINAYLGFGVSSSKYPPVLSAVALFVVIVVIYGVSAVLRGGWRHFHWQYIAVAIFVVWLLLDVLWQVRLAEKVNHTFTKYSGESLDRKLAISPDAKEFQFATLVKNSVLEPDARLFIVSNTDYQSMAVAYYLAPLNVFWNRGNSVMPEGKYLQKGDYLVLINPHNVEYLPKLGAIRIDGNSVLPVEVVFVENFGAVLKVK